MVSLKVAALRRTRCLAITFPASCESLPQASAYGLHISFTLNDRSSVPRCQVGWSATVHTRPLVAGPSHEPSITSPDLTSARRNRCPSYEHNASRYFPEGLQNNPFGATHLTP